MVYYYEKLTGRLVKELTCFPYYNTQQALHLLEYQDNSERFLISNNHLEKYFIIQSLQMSTDEKIQLYLSLFKGRRDVYAKSYVNDKGKIQYYPSYQYGWRKLPPEQRACEPLTKAVLKQHLRGEISIGIFPISKADTCTFLAIDFDKKDWRESVLVSREIAEQEGFKVHVENFQPAQTRKCKCC
ncbi:TOTE conflict system archaeo-eukaryotic primase domain-containing protein [Streptococcus orisasini]